ncbi:MULTISPECIES: DUF4265 domain-containing protein [unclassified Luteibacter]|uniref:DUF4265 domain-containing protein n=1 Tax=Luteibacter sp. PvP019 TaxID=3156436 RepID=UPI003399433E
MSDLVKIFFRIEPDEDGYPEVGCESVWAKESKSPHTYIIDNIPFFARQASLGDAVRVRLLDGVRWFDGVVSESPNSLMRVVCFDRTSVDDVAKELVALGCTTEYFKAYNLLAVSIPGVQILAAAESYLNQREEVGLLDYEGAIYRL